MILTDRFVYVHQPKTGGTFVTQALFRVHDAKWSPWRQLLLACGIDLVQTGKYGTFVLNNNKHGGCASIPAAHRHKPVLATVRNPYDHYVSQYEFGWWRRREFLRYFRRVPQFTAHYPTFPDITFDQYVRLVNAAFCTQRGGAGSDGAPGPDGPRFGVQTELFVKFYFRDPAAAFARLSPDYLRSGDYVADMFRVHFLRTERLNAELHAFLLSAGYEPADVAFVLELGKVRPAAGARPNGRPGGRAWAEYYTPDLKRYLREREWALFELFREYEA